MDVVIVVGLLAVFVVLTIGAVAAVVSAARVPSDRFRRVQRGKETTILLIILTGGFGGAYYWLRIRPELHRAGVAAAQNAPVPPPTKAERRAIEAQRYLGR
jgi:hypothetical protein